MPMKARILLFLSDELEPIVSRYVAEILQMSKPITLEIFGELPDDIKNSNEPVIVITQKELVEDLESAGVSLLDSVSQTRKSGIIILPDTTFATVETNEKKQIVIENYAVEIQIKKSIAVIMDESMPNQCIFLIDDTE